LADGAGGPVEKGRTRADRLKDAIAEAIVRGELAAGQRLDEVSVAQQFAVSRTPVREALKQLAAMDLVDLRPHRGAVVAGLDPRRLAALFEAMAEIEAICARLAATKMAQADRELLEVLWLRCDGALRRSGDIEAVHETNQDFHTAIHKGAGNEFLADAAHALRRRLAPLSRAQFGLTGRPSDSAAEHKAVMKAIRARDGAMAERAMRLHVESVRRAFGRWLDIGGSRISA
jgi:DNA-binding GntR family transcriptional regulator